MPNDESTFIEDVSRSVSQLCTQWSIANVNVPNFSSFKDVFEFIKGYEATTIGLSEEQRPKLLIKAFMPDQYQPWFESELGPRIAAGARWSDLKRILIERFANVSEQERHIDKLRALEFRPEAGQKLLDFVEYVLYSYQRAFPQEKDQKSRVAYVKACLPPKIKSIINLNPDFRNASSEEALKSAAKNYDVSQSFDLGRVSSSNSTAEFAKALQKAIEEIKRQNNAHHQVAALQQQQLVRNKSPVKERRKNDRYSRSPSPCRSQFSPGINRRAPLYDQDPSPQRSESASKWTDKRLQHQINRPKVGESSERREAFDSGMYWSIFKMPPSPCVNCKQWHWFKHCPLNLKE